MGIPNNYGENFSCKFAFVLLLLFVAIFTGCINNDSIDPLTREEREWLSEYDGKIRLAHDPNAKPIDFFDKENKFQGLAADYVRLIEKRLNFKFDILHIKTWDEVLKKAETKEIDVLCAFSKNQERSQFMLFTEPYVTIPVVILTRNDFKGNLDLESMKDLRVTFTEGWVVDDYLKKNYRHLNRLPAIDSDGALNNLITNRADAWVTALTVASIKIGEHEVTNLRVAGKTDISFNLCFASRNDRPMLHRILKKGLASISEEEREQIFNKWIHVKQQSIYESRPFWITVCVILGLAALFGILILSWNRTLKHKVEEKTKALENELFERIQAQDELQESVSLFSQMFEQSTTSMSLYNPDGTIYRVNNEFCKLFGVRETAIKDSGYNIFKDQAILEAGLLPLLNTVFLEKKTEKWEVNFDIDLASTSTGTPTSRTGKIFLEVFGYPVLTLKGDLEYVVLQHYDITERKRDEDEIRKQKHLFETMFNTITDGIVVTDTQREIQLANKGMESTFGYKPEELVGKSTNMLYADPNKFQETGETVFGETAKKPENLYMTRYKDRSGREFPGETFGARLFDENNQWIGNLGIMRDVTERVQAEARIQQSQKMESIGTLAGGIAHDFNNILFPIVGHTEMLLEDVSEDSPLRDSLNEIYTGSLRARDLVQHILAFSRQESNELKLMKMQPIIKEVLKLIRATIPTTISIRQNLQSDCGPVKADPTQIHQVIMNLTTNAYHAMEENGGELKVLLKEIELNRHEEIPPDMAPGPYACLTVADTGTGMNKEVVDKAFEPFFTTKKKGKGTGMGLSVVHGIVKRMNGAIQVHSEPGCGTEFQIFLPIVKKAFEKQETLPTESIIGGSESVLFVDDEKDIVAMGRQTLSRLGYQITTRTSSIEALEVFRANPDNFDLVITDMAMPKMSGDRLAVELIKIRPDIPVLLCTGFCESINSDNINAFGIRDLLMKPIVIKDLAKKIREILDS